MNTKNVLLIILGLLLIPVSPLLAATLGNQTKTSGCTANQTLPDPACTPGAVLTTNTAVVCKSGYSASVRDVSTATKKKVFAEYGISWSQHGNYEVDHLVSLEIGGSNDISNLWPELSAGQSGSFTKDKLENYLHAQVCKGTLPLATAQSEIATNWLTYYNVDILHQSAQTSPTGATGVPTAAVTAKTAPPSTSTTAPEVKKSSTGLCHARGTRYYAQTKTFTPYASLAACLASGGKLPKN